MSWLPDFIHEAHYFAVYFLMVIECFLPIFPSEVVMPIAALVASKGEMSLVGVILSGTAGALTGACIWYGVARSLGYRRFMNIVVRYGRITTVSLGEVEMLERWFQRFGSLLVLVGRLIPGLRSAVSIPAGLVGMGFPRFLALTFVGVASWMTVISIAGWLLRDHYDEIETFVGPATTIVVGAAVLFWLFRVVTYGRRNRA